MEPTIYKASDGRFKSVKLRPANDTEISTCSHNLATQSESYMFMYIMRIRVSRSLSNLINATDCFFPRGLALLWIPLHSWGGAAATFHSGVPLRIWFPPGFVFAIYLFTAALLFPHGRCNNLH